MLKPLGATANDASTVTTTQLDLECLAAATVRQLQLTLRRAGRHARPHDREASDGRLLLLDRATEVVHLGVGEDERRRHWVDGRRRRLRSARTQARTQARGGKRHTGGETKLECTHRLSSAKQPRECIHTNKLGEHGWAGGDRAEATPAGRSVERRRCVITRASGEHEQSRERKENMFACTDDPATTVQ